MATKLPDSLFDSSLTPQNAREKGYKYIDDVIYEPHNPSEAVIDILAFIRQLDGKLGVSANVMDSYVGLYLPLKNL